MSRATVLVPWSVPDVVRLDDLDTWSYPVGIWLDDVDTWSVDRLSDDVDTWPEFQRDGLDDIVPYLAADLFMTWFSEMCACVRVYRPIKR